MKRRVRRCRVGSPAVRSHMPLCTDGSGVAPRPPSNLLPPVSETTGLGLTAALTLVTFCTLPLIWRGPWEPRSPHFARRFLATLCVAMLTSFHNHVYGAALLLVPGMALLAGNTAGKPLQILLRVGLYAPPLLFLLTGSMAAVGTTYGMLFVAGIALIVASEIGARQHAHLAQPDRISHCPSPLRRL